MVDKADITGALGTPAPPGAPHETTAPGSERATPEQIATARANEVELPPFAPSSGGQLTVKQQAVFLGKSVEEIIKLRQAAGISVTDPPTGPGMLTAVPTTPANPAPTPPAAPLPAGTIVDASGRPVTSSMRPVPPRPPRSTLRTVHKPPTVVVGEPLEQQLPPEGLPADVDTLNVAPTYGAQPRGDAVVVTRDGVPVATLEIGGPEADAARAALRASGAEPSPLPVIPVVDPTAKHQPAASNTDSPTRGTPVPAATLPEGKRITGGFGDTAEAEYYPLDGTEALALADALMDTLRARLQDDLRFSMAITYPRLAMRVVLEVEAFGQDGTMTVEKVLVPAHEKTPLAVARLYGDQVVFCVTAERAEMTEDGQSIAPPNQTRQELRLPIPRKTAIQTPGGRMIVDVRR